jgi:hypothetical protein
MCENKKKCRKKNENNENPHNMHTFGICTNILKKKKNDSNMKAVRGDSRTNHTRNFTKIDCSTVCENRRK